MIAQIPLPLPTSSRLGRADFIVGPGNSAAVTLIDSWPDWTAPAAVLYGPSGSGKSHLAGVWAERAKAEVKPASELASVAPDVPLVIENIDAAPLSHEAETVLFALLERGQKMLITAHEPPAMWKPNVPDLRGTMRCWRFRCGRRTTRCSKAWRASCSPTASSRCPMR
jgi:chromosomal replication initiation ATPase DnaA